MRLRFRDRQNSLVYDPMPLDRFQVIEADIQNAEWLEEPPIVLSASEKSQTINDRHDRRKMLAQGKAVPDSNPSFRLGGTTKAEVTKAVVEFAKNLGLENFQLPTPQAAPATNPEDPDYFPLTETRVGSQHLFINTLVESLDAIQVGLDKMTAEQDQQREQARAEAPANGTGNGKGKGKKRAIPDNEQNTEQPKKKAKGAKSKSGNDDEDYDPGRAKAPTKAPPRTRSRNAGTSGSS